MHYPAIFLFLLLRVIAVSSLARHPTPASVLTLNNQTFIDIHPLTYEPYEATCLRLPDPTLPGLEPTTCETAIEVICEKLEKRDPSHLRRDVWIWIDLPGCAMGYYLPEGADVPVAGECEVEVFGRIWQKCAEDSKYNAGVVNVDEVPDRNGPGTAKEDGEIRCMMAPRRLTPSD